MNLHRPASSSPTPEAAGAIHASAPSSAADPPGFDIWRVVATLRRRLRLAAGVAGSVMLAAIILTLAATPKYTATASIMLDPRKEKILNTEDVLSGLPPDSSVVDTEVEVIKSRQLAERVVRELNLEEDSEFAAAGEGKGAPPFRKTAQHATTLRGPHEAVVDAVMSGLAVSRTGLTYVINVGFTSKNRNKAALVANKFADLLVLEQLEAKYGATQQAANWLNERLGALRNQTVADDAAVQQFKIAHNLMSAGGTNLTEQEISGYNQTLAQARAQVAEDEARLNTARAQLAKGSSGDDVGEALDSPVIQRLREQRAVASARVADLTGRYGDRHPEILKADRELQDIDAQIQAEIHRIISNLEAKVQVSRERAAAVAGTLGGARSALASNNRDMVRLNELQRAAEASRSLYESYLTRYKETSSQQGIEQSDARVISRAKVPSAPSSPKTALNMCLGLLVAIGSGLAAISVAEMLHQGIYTVEDVEQRLMQPYLGSVPLFASLVAERNKKPVDYVVEQPLSAFAEAFRVLGSAIKHARPGEHARVVAITSALPNEGKTTTSLCLGRTAALQGAKVVVVDCDLRRRNVTRSLRQEPSVGVLEVITGRSQVTQALVPDQATGLHLLPLASISVTAEAVFGGQAMNDLLFELRSRYDLVILDTAPVLPVVDTRILAPKADVTVLLASWRSTPAQAISRALKLLTNTGATVGGVALTRVDTGQQSPLGYWDSGFFYRDCKTYYVG
jgi:capsular exopolysaccharide synthesis family protein